MTAQVPPVTLTVRSRKGVHHVAQDLGTGPYPRPVVSLCGAEMLLRYTNQAGYGRTDCPRCKRALQEGA